MSILITGATGCLGRNLAETLHSKGLLVTATGRNISVGNQLEAKGIRFVPGSLENANNLNDLFKQQKIVFHCAALSSPWGKYNDFYQSNVIATRNVINQCLKHNINRLIYVSTPSIYFNFQDGFNIKEEDPLPNKLVNYYALTKLMAEHEIDKAYNTGLEVITIRPRAIFGSYDNALLPRLIKAAVYGRLPLINGGKNLVDVTFVGNVVEALILCMNAPKSAMGHKFNITNGQPMILKELIDYIFSKLGICYVPKVINYKIAKFGALIMEMIASLPFFNHEPKLTRYAVGVLAHSQTLDISKASNILGYKPIYTIEEGVEIYAEWWKQQ